MGSPRDLINKSAGLEFGAPRAALLEQALAALRDGADPEANAVALAMLAQQDPRRLLAAIEAGEQTIAAGARPHWIRLHLADAAVLAADDETALRFAEAVDKDYFAAEDLQWRVTRTDEIRAIALLRLGRTTQALEVTDALLAALSQRGDEDDLPSPSHLVRTALTMAEQQPELAGAARTVLAHVADILDLPSWFPPSVVTQIQTTLQAP